MKTMTGVSSSLVMGRGPTHQLDRRMDDREFAMADRDYRAIAAVILARTGIVLGDHKQDLVYSRLARRIRALKLPDFASYVAMLEGDGGTDEADHFISALTTNHTQFFREAHHFDFIREIAAPHWIERARETGDRRLRLWSAGCSTGEEAYSLAMTVQDALKGSGDWDLRILATDIDTQVLNHAKRGEYSVAASESIPPIYRNQYCKSRRAAGDTIGMSPGLRARISFNRLNLLSEWPMSGRFDGIFCRNVVIYFDAQTKARLIERYREILKPDGWLFLGHSETILGERVGLALVGRTVYTPNPGGQA
jgi:chemotaxis protein methyltransferase CheR